MKRCLILIPLLLVACTPNELVNDNEPYVLKIFNSNYSLAYATSIEINQNGVKITFIGGLVEEKPQVLWSKRITNSYYLSYLCNLDTAIFSRQYKTHGVQDGLQLSIDYRREKTKYHIHVANYYSPEIDSIVTYTNHLLPKDHRIYYDKEVLLELMK